MRRENALRPGIAIGSVPTWQGSIADPFAGFTPALSIPEAVM